jgi:hypothetical protein
VKDKSLNHKKMKASYMHINKIPAIMLLVSIVSLSACSSSDEPDSREKTLKTLTGVAWNIEQVMLDGQEYTDLYDGMTLTFNQNGTYSTIAGNSPVWDAEGTYELISAEALLLDGNRTVTIETIGSRQLTLSFDYQGIESRTSSIGGSYTFIYSRP